MVGVPGFLGKPKYSTSVRGPYHARLLETHPGLVTIEAGEHKEPVPFKQHKDE